MIIAKKVTNHWFFEFITPLSYSVFLLFFSPVIFAAEISDYVDCAKAGESSSDSSVPLTKAERIANLEVDYVRTVSQTERCEKNEESTGGASSGGASSTAQTLSKNAGTADIDIKVNSTLQSTASQSLGEVVGNDSTSTFSGKDHEDLERADNKAALRAQIKAAADKETDPEMKKILIEKYEALK